MLNSHQLIVHTKEITREKGKKLKTVSSNKTFKTVGNKIEAESINTMFRVPENPGRSHVCYAIGPRDCFLFTCFFQHRFAEIYVRGKKRTKSFRHVTHLAKS